MFNNGQGTAPAPPQGPPQRPTCAVPPLRTWEIRIWDVESVKIKTERVVGHGMTTLDNGGLIIQKFYVLANLGPTPFPVWGTSSYIDFKDITEPGGQSELVEIPILTPPQEDEGRIIH